MNWSTEGQLKKLLLSLVAWDSRTGREGESEFPIRLKQLISSIPYFQQNNHKLKLHHVGHHQQALTALYKSNQSKDTIILMSHFDTVHVEEYGEDSDIAFKPIELIERLRTNIRYFSEEIQADIKSGDYLFGRGTMDMKIGIAIHMHILEKAIIEKWPVNILLVSVPDEEVNSAGMRGIVPTLVEMKKEFSLHFQLVINSEPTFTETERDEAYYLYTGSIGKLMPTAYFYGKETHASQPLAGLSSNFMAASLTKTMEWNENFIEVDEGEKTPPPVCLQMNDLKTDYSVQVSHHSYALYNVFALQRNAEQMMTEFRKVTEEAMEECDERYGVVCEREGMKRQFEHIKVLEFHELNTYIRKKLGNHQVSEIENDIFQNDLLDDREKAIQLCDVFMGFCPELAPATIIFFSPSYYPAVTTANHPVNKKLVPFVQQLIKEKFSIEAKHVHYFPGISDLSYLSYKEQDEGWRNFQDNTPGWGRTYEIPFEAMKQLQVPLLNIGPFGKDAHKMTERLHMQSGFVHTPYIIEKIIKKTAEIDEKET